MRLPADVRHRILALGLTAALAGCGMIGGGGDRPSELAAAPVANGPAADYPMVLGDPFTVAGELYTPADTLNYDIVGYAVPDNQGGAGVTAAHKTLPLPCVVRVTNLENGRSTVVRVSDRGPFIKGRIIDVTAPVAKKLGFYRKGLARVEIEVLSVGDGRHRIR